MRKVPEPQRHWRMRSRNSGGSAAGSSSFSYSSFGLRFETTLRARRRSPRSVTTPTARPASTMTSRTGLCVRTSTPRDSRRPRHRLGDGAHSADGVAPDAFLAVHLAEHVVQQHIGRARRVGARIVADDAVEPVGGLDRRALEPAVEIIARRLHEQVEQLAAQGHVEPGDAPAEPRTAQELRQGLEPTARRSRSAESRAPPRASRRRSRRDAAA